MPEIQTPSRVKPLLALVAVLVLAFVALYAFFPKFRASLPFSKQVAEPTQVVVPTAELPKNFPANLPLVKASVVLHNFETTNDKGATQSVRKWQSVETPDHVKATYSEFFAKNGWEVVTQVDQPTLHILAARHNKQFMSVSIHPVPNGTGSLIEVTVK